jgi:hypothetical protein
LNVDDRLLHRAGDAFQQQLPFQHLGTQSAGIDSITYGDTSAETFFFCIHPKIAMT